MVPPGITAGRPAVVITLTAFLTVLVVFTSPSIAAQDISAVTDTTFTDTAVVPLAPAVDLNVANYKYDAGTRLRLSWGLSPDDMIAGGRVLKYEIFRSAEGGPFERIGEVITQNTIYVDQDLHPDSAYAYQLVAVGDGVRSDPVASKPVTPQIEWLNYDRRWLFVIALAIAGAVVYFVARARAGKELFIRKIAGLEAIDDAVGRATEMGRPVLFIPGINDMDDVQTLAALTILGRVSRTIADFDSKIFMPVARSLVMTAAREVIRGSYTLAGRPDAYSDDMVTYVTDEQFGYVAAVDGLMVREKPATIFLLGAFFAESLILAETGNHVGAIQIAGTARPAQLPFFIAACDFTLIGEELFAASAYLSGEPKQLGSLKGQDFGKGIAMIFVVVGTIAATISLAWQVAFFDGVYQWVLRVFSSN